MKWERVNVLTDKLVFFNSSAQSVLWVPEISTRKYASNQQKKGMNKQAKHIHTGQPKNTIQLNDPTADGGSLRQDSDGSYSSVLQLVDGTVLGPPAVWADPQEMTDLVRSLTGIQDAPGVKHTPSLSHMQCVCVCVYDSSYIQCVHGSI